MARRELTAINGEAGWEVAGGGRGEGRAGQTARESNSRRGKLLPPVGGGGRRRRAGNSRNWRKYRVKAPRFDNKDPLPPSRPRPRPLTLLGSLLALARCKGPVIARETRSRSFARTRAVTREDTLTGKEETFGVIRAHRSRRLIGEETRCAVRDLAYAI